jgi:hypothetical protein
MTKDNSISSNCRCRLSIWPDLGVLTALLLLLLSVLLLTVVVVLSVARLDPAPAIPPRVRPHVAKKTRSVVAIQAMVADNYITINIVGAAAATVPAVTEN